jgi:hypothetical protein
MKTQHATLVVNPAHCGLVSNGGGHGLPSSWTLPQALNYVTNYNLDGFGVWTVVGCLKEGEILLKRKLEEFDLEYGYLIQEGDSYSLDQGGGRVIPLVDGKETGTRLQHFHSALGRLLTHYGFTPDGEVPLYTVPPVSLRLWRQKR